MIEVIENPSHNGKRKQDAHPEWEAWFAASAYTPEVARKELGQASSTFYRRIKSPPDHMTRLAMAALYEGFPPFGATSEREVASGTVVQAGDDDAGQPRVIVHSTREALAAVGPNLIGKRVYLVVEAAA